MPKKEIAAIVLTASRYGIAEIMARHVKDGKPIIADMAAYIISDILDGEILRQFDLDTPNRRTADGIVDHLSMFRVMPETASKHPSSRPYIGILATRAVVVGAINAYHLLKTGESTKGQNKQRATNLSSSLFAVAANSGNEKLTHLTGAIASGIAVATIPYYLDGVGNQSPDGIRKI